MAEADANLVAKARISERLGDYYSSLRQNGPAIDATLAFKRAAELSLTRWTP